MQASWRAIHLLGVAGGLLVVAVAGLPAAVDGAPRAAGHVKAPKRGQYVGETRQRREATLYVARSRVKSAIFEVDCGLGSGRVTFQRAKLHRTRRGFAFSVHRRPGISYNDGHAPETARLDASGRFTRTGRKARGLVRFRSRHCGDSGRRRWSARYASPPVKAPRSGSYAGETKQRRGLELYTSGANVQLASIAFKCGDATGTTVLNDIDMRRTFRGFAFELRAHGSIGYSDGYPDENGEVDISGLFDRAGSKAHGWIRVKSPRCGGTGKVGWVARRSRSG